MAYKKPTLRALNRGAFSVRFDKDISRLIIEICNYDYITDTQVRRALHAAVESHITRAQKFRQQLKESEHALQEPR